VRFIIFAAVKGKNRRNTGKSAAATLLLVLLVWLSVSTPLVNFSQHGSNDAGRQKCLVEKAEETSPGGTEEKTGSNGSVNEYLHDAAASDRHPGTCFVAHCNNGHGQLLVFHPECFSPPPEA